MNTADAAWALLSAHRAGQTTLTRSGGSFCGELLTDPRPLSPKQADWLGKLLDKAGLAPLSDGGAHG